jgi:hypothetical protein
LSQVVQRMNGLIGMLRSIDCEYSVHQKPSFGCAPLPSY